MIPSVHASAPGKIILMGEHAAVYGKPALVAALGLRVRVDMAIGGSSVELILGSLGYHHRCSWREITAYREEKRVAWERFDLDAASDFTAVRGEDPAHVVKIALGEVLADLALESPPFLRVAVESNLPVGSGFGSSAAVAVAVVAAALRLLAGEAEAARVARLAMDVERRQHGHPSGIDHETVLRGGVVLLDSQMAATPVDVGDWARRDLAIYDTGSPAETTGEVVAAVRRHKDASPERFQRMLDRMGQDVGRFQRLLEDTRPDAAVLQQVIADYQSCLETLGVVPVPVSHVLRRLAELGAAAKISGAGALSGERAGCLLVYRRPEVKSRVDEILSGYSAVRAPIGAEGLSIEAAV
ncbi:MAG: hypothetical protein OEM62_02090 [Acidobacteriota bacterium]|nr:hypothetical protein [Acidobacteriota bacterium]